MSNVDAANAVLCSYLGLTSRDLAEIGDFSERFARDLLAGRRPFPNDVQGKLLEIRRYVGMISEAMYLEVVEGDPTIYIYRTIEQLRNSPVGRVWPTAYLGPFRVAAFQVMERCNHENRRANVLFASFPNCDQ